MSRNLLKITRDLKNRLFGYYVTRKTSQMTMSGLIWLTLTLPQFLAIFEA